MPLVLDGEDATRLARELAELTGETVSEAVATALREHLQRLRNGAGRRLLAFAEEIRADYDTRSVRPEEWSEL